MAVIRPGLPIAGIRGSLGGTTFSVNQSGPYCKPWSKPPRTKTYYQALARSYFTHWSPFWQALTPAERADWDTFAASPPETDYDRFGIVTLRTGFQWFMRLNQRRALLGGTPISLAPAAVAQTAPIITSLTIKYPITLDADAIIGFAAGEFTSPDLAFLFIQAYPSAGVQKLHTTPIMQSIQGPWGADHMDFGLGFLTRMGPIPTNWQCNAMLYRQNADGIRSAAGEFATIVIDA